MARLAPQAAIHGSPCGATLYEIGYEYDAVGNRRKMTSTAARAYSTDANTQALFHLDEPEDAIEVADSSGKGLVGDVSGNVLLGAEGRLGTCADFDGLSGSEIKVTDSADLEVGSGEFAIEAWIMPDGDALATETMTVVSKWCEVEGSEARSYLLLVNADGKLEGRVWGAGDESQTVISDASLAESLTDKEWVHVAMERNSSDELSLWVDRVKQTATATLTFALADTDEAFRIGAAGNVEGGDEADGMYFVGAIDEVRLSKIARGAAGTLGKVVVTYAHNARNQLTTESSGASVKTYSYDNNGNTVGIVETVNSVQVAEETMAYDEMNRMVSYSGPEGSESFSYRGAEWHRFSADGTSFLYDGDNVLADMESGTVTRTYVAPFLDESISMTADGSTYYYSQDGLGSVRTLTDSLGADLNRYDYLPFGEALASATSATVPQRYTYTGRERNPVSPAMYYRYRPYSPPLGIMLNRNPWGYIHRSFSLYDAMNANPVLYREPFSPGDRTASRPMSMDEFNMGREHWTGYDDPGKAERERQAMLKKQRENWEDAKEEAEFRSMNKKPTPYDVGFEAGFIKSWGQVWVRCCDENDCEHLATLTKECWGLITGSSASAHVLTYITGRGCPDDYKGVFYEWSVGYVATVGGAISEKAVLGESSGVNAPIGVGVGLTVLPLTLQRCYYEMEEDVILGPCP